MTTQALILEALLSSIGAEVALRVGILDGFITGSVLAFVEGGLGGLIGSAVGMALMGKAKKDKRHWQDNFKDVGTIISSMLVPGLAAVLSQMYPTFLPVPRYLLILVFQIIVSLFLSMF